MASAKSARACPDDLLTCLRAYCADDSQPEHTERVVPTSDGIQPKARHMSWR